MNVAMDNSSFAMDLLFHESQSKIAASNYSRNGKAAPFCNLPQDILERILTIVGMAVKYVKLKDDTQGESPFPQFYTPHINRRYLRAMRICKRVREVTLGLLRSCADITISRNMRTRSRHLYIYCVDRSEKRLCGVQYPLDGTPDDQIVHLIGLCNTFVHPRIHVGVATWRLWKLDQSGLYGDSRDMLPDHTRAMLRKPASLYFDWYMFDREFPMSRMSPSIHISDLFESRFQMQSLQTLQLLGVSIQDVPMFPALENLILHQIKFSVDYPTGLQKLLSHAPRVSVLHIEGPPRIWGVTPSIQSHDGERPTVVVLSLLTTLQLRCFSSTDLMEILRVLPDPSRSLLVCDASYYDTVFHDEDHHFAAQRYVQTRVRDYLQTSTHVDDTMTCHVTISCGLSPTMRIIGGGEQDNGALGIVNISLTAQPAKSSITRRSVSLHDLSYRRLFWADTNAEIITLADKITITEPDILELFASIIINNKRLRSLTLYPALQAWWNETYDPKYDLDGVNDPLLVEKDMGSDGERSEDGLNTTANSRRSLNRTLREVTDLNVTAVLERILSARMSLGHPLHTLVIEYKDDEEISSETEFAIELVKWQSSGWIHAVEWIKVEGWDG